MAMKLSKRIGILKSIKSYLPRNERILLYNAMIKPLFLYCSQWRNATAGGPPSIGHFWPLFAPLKIGWIYDLCLHNSNPIYFHNCMKNWFIFTLINYYCLYKKGLYANFGLSKNDMHDGLQRITSQYHTSFILPFLMFCRRRHRLQEETTNQGAYI
jgi:hypothetical protein